MGGLIFRTGGLHFERRVDISNGGMRFSSGVSILRKGYEKSGSKINRKNNVRQSVFATLS